MVAAVVVLWNKVSVVMQCSNSNPFKRHWPRLNWFSGRVIGLLLSISITSTTWAQSGLACRDSLTGQIWGKDRKGPSQATPLPGATIYLKETRQGAAADANGRFRLTDLCPGHYTAEYRFEGYEPLIRQIQVPDSGRTALADSVNPSC